MPAKEEELNFNELCIEVFIRHPTMGRAQRIHAHLEILDDEGEFIGDTSFLRLANNVGDLAGMLGDNQHLMLVTRDQEAQGEEDHAEA